MTCPPDLRGFHGTGEVPAFRERTCDVAHKMIDNKPFFPVVIFSPPQKTLELPMYRRAIGYT